MRPLNTRYTITMRPTNIATMLRTATQAITKNRVFIPSQRGVSIYTPPQGHEDAFKRLMRGES